MCTKDLQAGICNIPNRDVSTILHNTFQSYHNCRDYRVYESKKREISQACRGNWQVYDRAIYLLSEILGI